ncbi:hypothetical protein ACNAPC_27865, partial [Klebsiella pneumoniae]|uniref:hypothetical protein n=1 Tax=Klebsiella pneumoniae TaxID=573 RepID=UPI003A4D7B71
ECDLPENGFGSILSGVVAFFCDHSRQNTSKTIFRQITLKPLRHKGWRRFLTPELSLKYKYKDRAHETPAIF